MMEKLYEHNNVTIYEENPDLHCLVVGDYRSTLGRGILNELAITKDADELNQKMSNVDPGLLEAIVQYGQTVESVGRAISQARINLLEQEVSYYIGETVRMRDS